MFKPTLKIFFTDFWSDFNNNDNFFIHLLAEQYQVIVDPNPEILIYSSFSENYRHYHCPKIFYTGENSRPDFRECDFALSFDLGLPKDKHYRIPLYRFNGKLESLVSHHPLVTKEQVSKKLFCCMVVSNGGGSMRNEFFHQLSAYKQVDSGGKFLNNIGGSVQDKMEFISRYKFVLSFENTSYPGYTTEKLIEPFFAGNIPLYWGNPEIEKEFNSNRFINVHDFESMQHVVEEIIRIDNDDDLYLQYVQQPVFINNIFPDALKWDAIGHALVNAVQSLLGKSPVLESNKYYSWKKTIKKKISQQLNKLTK